MLHRPLVTLSLAVSLLLLIAACQPPPPPVTPQPPASAPAPPPPPSGPVSYPEVTLSPTINPAAETNVRISERTHTLSGVNLRLSDLISVACRTPETTQALVPLLSALRVVSARPLPTARYDVRVFVPNGNAAQLRAALREVIESTFGISIRKEQREANVLVLAAPTGSMRETGASSRPAILPGRQINRQGDSTSLELTGDNLSLLTEQLEEALQEPVVNGTDIRGPYALFVQQPGRMGTGQPFDLQILQSALREQLGLDLVPARRSIEFLVVDGKAGGRQR